jgi:hypothetical protein
MKENIKELSKRFKDEKISVLSAREELYWKLKKAQQNKQLEEQKFENLHIINFIPPWQLLFVSGLGVVIVRLLNKGTDLVCDKDFLKPFSAILIVHIFIAVCFVMIYCF